FAGSTGADAVSSGEGDSVSFQWQEKPPCKGPNGNVGKSCVAKQQRSRTPRGSSKRLSRSTAFCSRKKIDSYSHATRRTETNQPSDGEEPSAMLPLSRANDLSNFRIVAETERSGVIPINDCYCAPHEPIYTALEQVPILARVCVAALVHAVGHRECLHLFDPEVGDCAARRGTSDLVDRLGHFRDALQCCGEKNPRAFSTGDTCVDRHTCHQSGSFKLCEASRACGKL